jgi:pyrimidine-nucleoside phosphorylase
MRVVDLIRRKRDGGSLGRDQIDFLVQGVTSGAVPDYQAAALLMAIVWRGMTDEETLWLSEAMARSGRQADFSDIPGVKADKHSTGGVGDTVSLVLVPLAAACGLIVPKMSGRALGHTGGTLDKLDAIPGFRTSLTLAEIHAALSSVGCALVAQTAEMAPADRTLYALRDVTATVDSIPLIAASIMSKKLAEGLDALVLDVKVGRGAFMKTEPDARALARVLVMIGQRAGVRTEAVLTRMDVPLGRAVGNALEVAEAVGVLSGRRGSPLEAVAVELTATLLRLAGLDDSDEAARARAARALASGAAQETFRRLVANQGGDPRVIDDPARLPRAPQRHVVRASRDGYLVGLDAELVGRCAMLLGSGRVRKDAPVDPSAGVVLHARVGDRVASGDAVVELHYRDETGLSAAVASARAAMTIQDEAVEGGPLVLGRVA